ncbi:MAG: ATP synthase subunit C [Methylomonas sp.]|nr:ATP synthase subunit C [Methylomonas sp.]PPD22763.1 MAG: V-type ATP synthase subunit K [Methylomonas sp.]PPD26748.1 MAG: V-type ATP synthase subunit K [Methylomonas sp.]PPD38584.1 MAG: V-type ATP synthase subunit K [Methylomonas sp.]PPD42797.1 MAG: V-type ATP synthase subunit K [Methylomonas sp.]
MNEVDALTVGLAWAGIFAPLALGAFGSVIGCAIAGQAAIGAMLDVETGFARYIGVSVMPSSQTIYGIVATFTLNRTVTAETAGGLIGLGFLAGIVLAASAIWQGHCCASAIQATKVKPEMFGLSLAPAAVVEGFAVFIFVFLLVLSADIPQL